MSVGENVIKLAATTSAAVSDVIVVPAGAQVTVACVPQLVSAETATVQYSMDGGGTFEDYEDTTTVQLSATNSLVLLHGPCLFKVSKGASVTATAVHIQV